MGPSHFYTRAWFVGGAKKGAPGKDKPGSAKAKPKEKVWTAEDEAARKIQTMGRGYIARKQLKILKQKKQEYEELMDKLEKEVRWSINFNSIASYFNKKS